jgi:hypothetical protein
MGSEWDIAEHLKSLEVQLLQFAIRTSVGKVRALPADEFVEFGSSGRVRDKQFIIASLQQESPVQIKCAPG